MCYKCVFEQAHVPRVFRVGVRVHLTYKARSYDPHSLRLRSVQINPNRGDTSYETKAEQTNVRNDILLTNTGII